MRPSSRLSQALQFFNTSRGASIWLAIVIALIGVVAFFDLAGVSRVRRLPAGVMLAALAWSLAAFIMWAALRRPRP